MKLKKEYSDIQKSEMLSNFPIDEYEKRIKKDEIKGSIMLMLRIILCAIVSLVILSWISILG